MSVLVCKSSALKEGHAKSASVHGTDVAVWRVGGRLFALENECAHKAASLHKGDIEDIPGVGLCVRCPKHRKKFAGGLYVHAAFDRTFDRSDIRSIEQVLRPGDRRCTRQGAMREVQKPLASACLPSI